MRLFIALDLSPEIHQQLSALIAKMKSRAPNLRFVRPEGLHITLKFLGETPASKLDILETALSQIEHPAFPLTVENLGFFPDAKRPRIFWAGISAPPDTASLLAAKVDHACTFVGLPPEKHEWKPHITLARIGSGNPQHFQPKADTQKMFGMMMVTQFHIYESTLHPQGSIYNKIATFPLKSKTATKK
jgi:2'-5' RNA ligase